MRCGDAAPVGALRSQAPAATQIMRTRVPDIDPDWEHPSGKSCICSGRRPKVHSGFQASYESGAVKSKILMLVLSLLESGQVDVTRAMFYTTGHSLGGALAALCASAPPSRPICGHRVCVRVTALRNRRSVACSRHRAQLQDPAQQRRLLHLRLPAHR